MAKRPGSDRAATKQATRGQETAPQEETPVARRRRTRAAEAQKTALPATETHQVAPTTISSQPTTPPTTGQRATRGRRVRATDTGETEVSEATAPVAAPAAPHGEIAIVGMAGMFPGAPDLETYWRNIVGGVDAIADVPPGRWETTPFFDPASEDDDRIYSKKGGYLPTEIAFDPLRYGIMPVAVSGGEVDQFLVLKLVQDALIDAGLPSGVPVGERTEFILGRGNYLGPGNSNLFQRSIGIEQALRLLRTIHPEHTDEELEALRRDLRASLPPFGPELGATHIPNVVTGRSANRLDFMGPTYTVDAACASSLIAVSTAMSDLLTGKCDLAIAGGSHTFTCVPLLMVFSTLDALSRSSRMRPFDAEADGTLPGEGIGILILKRRADAERDGNRIYALIKGVGSASDGRAVSVMAPRVEGETLALRRAYEAAAVDPRSVGLIEVHGTATTIGDKTEIEALKLVFGSDGGGGAQIGLGTVKSMIGHAMPASGAAGLIKTALALYHKVLPPTLHCETPNPALALEYSPFYMNTETRPWINGHTTTPRRAGVNAFGFGGINAHVVLEEYTTATVETPDTLPWDSELLLIGGDSTEAVRAEVARLQDYLAERPEVALADLAYTLNGRFSRARCRLAIIAGTHDDLQARLTRAASLLSKPDCRQIKDPRGVYYLARGTDEADEERPGHGKIAFLFPGEGSQRLNMLAQLCLHFPEVRAVFDNADDAIYRQGRTDPISAAIFPPPLRSAEARQAAESVLWQIDRQCEAIMAANRAMVTLLRAVGVRPDMMVGHSIGEWSALTAAEVAEADPPVAALRSLDAMARAITSDPAIPTAALLAIATNRAVAETIIEGIDDAYIALDNCPHQVVLAASEAASERVVARLRERGVGFERSRFDRGSHTPLFAGFIEVARRHFAGVSIAAPQVPVYSCLTTEPLPADPGEIRTLLARSWEQPVEFRQTIERMYADGARIFIEAGPGGVLSAFTDDILRGKSALVLAIDLPKWSNLTGLNHLVGLLTAQGLNLNTDYLFARRPGRTLTLDAALDAPALPDAGRPRVLLNLAIPMMTLGEEAIARVRGAHAVPIQTDRPDSARSPLFMATNGAGGRALEAGHNSAAAMGESNGHRDLAALGPPLAVGEARHSTLSPTANVAPLEAATAEPVVGAAHAPLPLPIATAVDVAGAVPTTPPTDGVVAHYMQSMQRFLHAEQRVVGSVLDGAPMRSIRQRPQRYGFMPIPPYQQRATRRPAGPDDQAGPFPLLGEILSLVPGQEVTARRQINPSEDLYLHDHTFGGPMSVTDPTLEPLVVAPLTISLELMAEAAALVLPGLLVTGMTDIRAHRWVQVDEVTPTILEIHGLRLPTSAYAVRVEVRQREADGKEAMVIEGTIVFGERYAAAPTPRMAALTNPRQTIKNAVEMYREKWMFHGPIFQGVASLGVSGDDGIDGMLEVLPTSGMFRSTDRPRLLTDVALLDAAGQLLGYWAKERLTSHFVVFPIRVAAVEIFGPNLPVGARVRCHVRIVDIMPQMVKVNMEVYTPQGGLWMRIDGWQDWRFHIIGTVYDFWRFPNATIMSTPCAVPVPAGSPPEAIASYRLDVLPELGQTMVTKCLAYMALNREERRTYHSLRGPLQRQLEWLAGRIAAKDAMRVYLWRRYRIQVGPGDIAITNDVYGRPEAHGTWRTQVREAIGLSIAHTAGSGIALVGLVGATMGVGIDLQTIATRPNGFDEIAFTPQEREHLSDVGSTGPIHDERVTRLWCAKEAVAKALGRGLIEGPRSLALERWHETTGTAEVALRGLLAAEFPHLAGRRILAYTVRQGDQIIATSYGQIASHHGPLSS